MNFIEEPFIEGETTVLKVSYKGNIWERRENNKLIYWAIYTEDTKTFIYRCVLSINKWHRYINDCVPPKDIEIPFIEKSYMNSIKKLYKFELDEYNTTLYGMFVSNKVDIDNVIGKTINIGEVYAELDWNMIEEIAVSNLVIDSLLKATNNKFSFGTICGYNPLHYLMEYES